MSSTYLANDVLSSSSPFQMVMVSLPTLCSQQNNASSFSHPSPNDIEIQNVKYYIYGILLPVVCAVGIVGNVFNLVVLSQPNMSGAAFVYMKGDEDVHES